MEKELRSLEKIEKSGGLMMLGFLIVSLLIGIFDSSHGLICIFATFTLSYVGFLLLHCRIIVIKRRLFGYDSSDSEIF